MGSNDTEAQAERAQASEHKDVQYERAMHRALARKPLFTSDGTRLTLEEIYDRARTRAETNVDNETPKLHQTAKS